MTKKGSAYPPAGPRIERRARRVLHRPVPIPSLARRAGDGSQIASTGYTYEFGDHWQHRITIEEITTATAMSRGYGFVEAGEGACPPEDAGGSHSYQDFLDQLVKVPLSKEVREFRRWAGEDFDSDRFDRHAANAALLRMAWNRLGEK